MSLRFVVDYGPHGITRVEVGELRLEFGSLGTTRAAFGVPRVG